MTQHPAKRASPIAPDRQARTETRSEGQNLDLTFLCHQQAESTFGSLGPSRIRIEIDHYVTRKASQKQRLKLGKGSPRAGDHIVKAGGEYRDAVHLTFDQDGVVQLADRLLGLVEIKQK